MPRTAKEIMESRFKDVPHKKIIIFHSPADCSKITYERVNPDHVAIIWGTRKKSENKGVTQIKLGEMYFGMTLFVAGTLMTNVYSAILGFAFPDMMLWEATACLAVYGITGAIILFPKGIGRLIVCMVGSLMVRLRPVSSSAQLS
jgi:hypothetical protein